MEQPNGAMRSISPRPSLAALVVINLALLPPGIWPHFGFAYLLLQALEPATASLPWRDTLASCIVIGASGVIATLDVVAERWFSSRPHGFQRWEGPAYAVLCALMALVHVMVMALFIFLWIHDD
jgi:hypothetical protein